MRRDPLTQGQKIGLCLAGAAYFLAVAGVVLRDVLERTDRRVDVIDHRRGDDLRVLDAYFYALVSELEKAGVLEKVTEDDGMGPRMRAVRRS
jgi:hypothetical protein